MVPVKTTAAVLVASMSLFSAVPASAAGLVKRSIPGTHTSPNGNGNGTGGSTPITGSSSEGSGPVNGGSPTGSTGSGAGSVGGGNNNGGSVPGSVPGTSSSGTGLNGSASPINSGSRPSGDNTSRPGPRTGADQPNAGGTGPFGEQPVPRTMDGTEGSGFNFGNMLSGFYSLTGTIFQLVATFAMLKEVFGWFGKGKSDAENAASGAKEVVAVADRGTNVARDASTKVDETIEAERARREANGGSGSRTNGAASGDGTGDPDSSGLKR